MLRHHLAVFFKATACDEIQNGLLAKIVHMSLEERMDRLDQIYDIRRVPLSLAELERLHREKNEQ
ncbi:hypothetical protein [Photobacterium profundum]|uniref:hypothetical protein n=1 Tax=Photobacterium profundum TaxID=74109 RepID=UPI0002F8C21C|nr:hypothetical protein [Photobacterium profundum]